LYNNSLSGAGSVWPGDVWAVGIYWDLSPPQTQVLRYSGPCSTPAETASPTPTVTPASALDGHVTWDGRPSQPSPLQQLPISLTLRLLTGGPNIDYPLQTTDQNGHFSVSVSGLSAGDYYWRVKGPQYLANAGTLTLSGAPLTQVEMGLMRAGDSNGDNVVNTVDFTI